MKGYLQVVNQNIPTDIIEYTDFKVKAYKYRQEFANRQGLEDTYIKKYDRTAALGNFQNKAYHNFFIVMDNKKVGCLEVKEEESLIDENKVGVLKAVYVDEDYRNYLTYEKVIYEVQEMYPMRIEAEMWYEQPEIAYFRKFGFCSVNTRMTLT